MGDVKPNIEKTVKQLIPSSSHKISYKESDDRAKLKSGLYTEESSTRQHIPAENETCSL